jgi:hypothetical protein
VPGIAADPLREAETEGSSWYNGLEVSLTKQLSHGLQILASYTFSRTLDTDGADINGTSAENTLTLGDQNSPAQRWGRASFDRTPRFVFSAIWALPTPADGLQRAFLGNWSFSAVATIRSGSALIIADTNSKNVYGISEDRAQLTGTCTKNQLVRTGSVESNLNEYFNASGFAKPPVIGADGIGTTFGNSGTGLVKVRDKRTWISQIPRCKRFPGPMKERPFNSALSFFNAFNHPQFANPDTNFSSPTFGVISSTSVSARVAQLALKLSF